MTDRLVHGNMLATPAQRQLLERLEKRLTDEAADALYLRVVTHLPRSQVAGMRYRWLSRAKASELIEAYKNTTGGDC